MRARNFILGIMIAFIPFLFAVNILRTQGTGNKENYLGLNGFLQYASEIDFSFSETYTSIAKTGEAWKEQNENPNAENFFKALWKSIQVPFIAIGELLTSVYDCITIFVKFVGLMPDGSNVQGGGMGGSDGGGGGGGGSRPA